MAMLISNGRMNHRCERSTEQATPDVSTRCIGATFLEDRDWADTDTERCLLFSVWP